MTSADAGRANGSSREIGTFAVAAPMIRVIRKQKGGRSRIGMSCQGQSKCSSYITESAMEDKAVMQNYKTYMYEA
jgi:hypothetical protein